MNSKELRTLGAAISAGLARGMATPTPAQPLPAQPRTPHVPTARELADERCGYTHCNNCCGPCPKCGHEGAYYGDPDR